MGLLENVTHMCRHSGSWASSCLIRDSAAGWTCEVSLLIHFGTSIVARDVGAAPGWQSVDKNSWTNSLEF